jgi:hypothetical protein
MGDDKAIREVSHARDARMFHIASPVPQVEPPAMRASVPTDGRVSVALARVPRLLSSGITRPTHLPRDFAPLTLKRDALVLTDGAPVMRFRLLLPRVISRVSGSEHRRSLGVAQQLS